MSTIRIADKPTLDNIDSNVTYIKNNLPSGGGGNSPTLIVLNKNNDFNNLDVTVSDKIYNKFTSTQNMGTNSYITFEVPWLGEYEVSYTISGITLNSTVSVDMTGGVVFDKFSIVTFSDASDETINTMLTAHYNNEIDLSTVWAVGDTRTINLSSMSTSSGIESHAAQTQELVIIDFNHDDLTTTINGHSKAAVSLGLKNCLNEKGVMNNSGSSSDYQRYPSTTRYSWCNSKFISSLPDAWRIMVKSVTKNYAVVGSKNTTTFSCIGWLPTSTELCNTYNSDNTVEGFQYEYYKTTSNRIKKVNGTNSDWWSATPNYYYSGRWYFSYMYVYYYNGNMSYTTYYDSTSYGICPHFCI